MSLSWLREPLSWINPCACLLAWLALRVNPDHGTPVAFSYADLLWLIYAGGTVLLTMLRLASYRFPGCQWGVTALSAILIAGVGYTTWRYSGFRAINIPFLVAMTVGLLRNVQVHRDRGMMK